MPVEKEDGFAEKTAGGKKALAIDVAALGRAVNGALNDRGMTSERLADVTYVSGKPADHKSAVERILKGLADPKKDAAEITNVAEYLGIAVPYASAVAKKSPFEHARKAGGGMARGGTPTEE